MKKLFFISGVTVALLSACGDNNKETKTETAAADTSLQFFGDSINQEGAMPSTELAAKMEGKDSMKVKLMGTINEVCQKKGCWMTMPIGNDKTMQVKFKDYAFFVPKDASGKTVVIAGVAFTDTTSVAELQHYAEDGGKSKEEIAKITEPEINISFEASGVILKK
ncbi:MAG: amino acid aminotransferase [Bacteroidota bacterium]|jgi:hypothetical protein|nr:amino acid aminotransferase [Bacteroidota bacterium]